MGTFKENTATTILMPRATDNGDPLTVANVLQDLTAAKFSPGLTESYSFMFYPYTAKDAENKGVAITSQAADDFFTNVKTVMDEIKTKSDEWVDTNVKKDSIETPVTGLTNTNILNTETWSEIYSLTQKCFGSGAPTADQIGACPTLEMLKKNLKNILGILARCDGKFCTTTIKIRNFAPKLDQNTDTDSAKI